jgi:hypothetical protein
MAHKEDQFQVNVARYLDLMQRDKFVWFHVPNGGLRNKYVARKLKAQGVKSGVWDCIICNGPIMFWIELKLVYANGRKNYLSKNQKNMRDDLIELGMPPDHFKVFIAWMM